MSNDNVTTSGLLTVSSFDDWSGSTTTIENPYAWKTISGSVSRIIEPKKGGDENMRYLYEVILVNPKNDTFMEQKVIARSEISALMKAYYETGFETRAKSVPFDDLKTSCRVLMEWKKKESLKKAIETIKKAVE